MFRNLSTAVIGLCCAMNSALAQTNSPAPSTRQSMQVFSQHHCSTALEGALRGQADAVRADGERTLNESEAARNDQAAYEQSLKNDALRVDSYYAKKSMHDEYERSQKRSTPSTSSSTLVTKSARVVCGPQQLSADGTISFPPALQNEGCSLFRKQLEVVFSRRAAGYSIGIGTPEYASGRAAIAMISANLKGRINDLPTTEYIAARNLLTGLARELGRTPVRALVASNRMSIE